MNHDEKSKAIAVEVMQALESIVEKIAPGATTADVCSGLLLAAASTMFDEDNLPTPNPIINMVGASAVAAGSNEVGLLIGSIIKAFHDVHKDSSLYRAMAQQAKSAMYN